MKQDLFFWFKELMKIEIKKKEKRDLYRYQPERSFKDRKKDPKKSATNPPIEMNEKNCLGGVGCKN